MAEVEAPLVAPAPSRTAVRRTPRPRPGPSTAPRRAPRPAVPAPSPRLDVAARASSIRWDRVGRIALVGVLGVILLLYASPLLHWVEQSRTAHEQRAELRLLEREHRVLAARARALRSAEAIEREARALGMVRRGERAYVIDR